MARLHVLGAGSRAATLSRSTTAYLIETRRALILVGAGSGVSRLQDPWFQELLARVPRALILIPSLRHDFVSGLPELPTWLHGREVGIAGPPAESGQNFEQGLGRWLERPFVLPSRAEWLASFGGEASLSTLRAGRQRLLGESVEVLLRSGHDLALRVRDVVFALGQSPGPDLEAFAARAALLVVGGDTASESEGVRAMASLARAANVHELLIAHHPPSYDAAGLEALLFAASPTFPRTSLASDMALVTLAGVEEEDVAPDAANEDAS